MEQRINEELVAKAKNWAHLNCVDRKKERKWLSGGAIPNSYTDPGYEIRVEVLEGSPPRAILIATPWWVQVLTPDVRRKIFRVKYGPFW